MSGLTLTLLGSPCLARAGIPIHLRSRKSMALLAYLTVNGAGYTRASLMALFWPESDTRRAQGALRHALWALRRALEGAWLVTDHQVVVLDGSERAAVDVLRYRDLLAQCQTHGHSTRDTCEACRPLLAEAVDLYQGDFMSGFGLRDSPQFDEWHRLEAQALRDEQAAALEPLAQAYASQGDFEGAIAYAQRWLALDSLHEPAHRYLMRLYAVSDRRASALRQYETCRRLLLSELGECPGPETAALHHAIQERRLGDLLAPASPASEGRPDPTTEGYAQDRPSSLGVASGRPRHNLPPEPTPFVGRQSELAQLVELLADPGCRLVSIVGPGGVGKSRLALRAGVVQVRDFLHGVWFVPLGSLESPGLLASTILQALAIPAHGSMTPDVQLLNILRDRQLLLILDNFEHLLEATALIAEVLAEAPGVRFLVTSRERLNLLEEWLLPLQGMRFPTEEETDIVREEEAAAVWGGVVSEPSVSSLEGYAAIQLFVQCAHRVRPDFSLLTAGASSVSRICRLVEGMPLAIEMAAAWTRVMRCRNIAREIEQGLGFLDSSLRNVPLRHRSMRAVFDHSWGLLPTEEQDGLCRLSAFRGGFRREAAEEVAGASLTLLAALVDKSWLRSTSAGRYEIHELIRQYCVGMLESEPGGEGARKSERVGDQHSRYFGAFLEEREAHLRGRRQSEALREIVEDMDNVWTAWRWAVERGDVETIGKFLEAFRLAGEVRGWYHEVYQALEQGIAKLRQKLDLTPCPPEDPRTGQTTVVLAAMLAKHGEMCFHMGLHQDGIRRCEESLALLRDAEPCAKCDSVSVDAETWLGWLVNGVDPSRAKEHHRRALVLADRLGDPLRRQHALWALGHHAHGEGHYTKAQSLAEEAIAVADETGEQWLKAACMDLHYWVLCARGQYEEAETVATEGLRLRQGLGDRSWIGFSFAHLGEVAVDLGKYELAEQYFQRGITIADEVGYLRIKVENLSGQGRLALMLGQKIEAKKLFEEGLAVARELGPLEWDSATSVLVGLGHANLVLGITERAKECFSQVLEEAIRRGTPPRALSALGGLASLAAQNGETKEAVALIALVLSHPSTQQRDKDRAERLLTRLEFGLSHEVLAAARAPGQARELEEVAQEILAQAAASNS